MEGYAQFYGYAEARIARHVGRASCEIVCGVRAHVDVLGVIVGRGFAGVGLVGEPCPLRGVACAFEEAWQAACAEVGGVASGYIAHASAEAHGVGTDVAAVVAVVGEDDAVVAALPCGEVEGAEVDPCAAAHLLVYAEAGGLAAVVHGVGGIADAGGERGVADIDGIAAVLGDVGRPGGLALIAAALLSGNGARSAMGEGVLAVEVDVLELCEACGTIGPRVLSGRLGVGAVHFGRVVVDDDLVALPVALAWRVEHGAGVLEHRH